VTLMSQQASEPRKLFQIGSATARGCFGGLNSPASAVAFSRSGDLATGDFSDATVLRKFGDVSG
jgi:hypothetical protein